MTVRLAMSWAGVAAVMFSGGCAQLHYQQTKTGHLHGRLLVEWIGPDQFIFHPDPDPAQRLTFTRANGDVITPGEMYTDGGSIPRPLWVFPAYSPWGYAPAYIIHDWLFDAHHCGDLPLNYTVDDAAMVMTEVMKTMMEETAEPDAFTLYTTYEAVKSRIARNLWDTGRCSRPQLAAAKEEVSKRNFEMNMDLLAGAPPSATPVVQTVIEWPPKSNP